MRKYWLIAAMCVGLGLLAGCAGNKDKNSAETTTEVSSIDNLDAKEYVKLGQYKGMVIEVDGVKEITDKEIDAYIKDLASDYAEYVEVTDRTEVKENDIIKANIQYLVNGEIDDVYSGTDIDIKVGADDYTWMADVDVDMDDKLVGAKVGDTVSTTFTYPQDYEYDNYAGKDCVIEVTITSIEEEKAPEITDAWVKETLDVDSVKQLRTQIKDELQTEEQDKAESEKIEKMWDQIEANAEQIQEFPESLIKENVDNWQARISEEAAALDIDEKQYREDYMRGLTAEEYVKRDYFLQCIRELIAEKENITVSDDELNEYLEQYVDGENLTNVDEVMKQFGSKKAAQSELLDEKIQTFLKKENVFK